MQGHSKMTSLQCRSDPQGDRKRVTGFIQTVNFPRIFFFFCETKACRISNLEMHA